MTKKQVAIVGGGIIGATAAFYLSKHHDIETTLFDTGKGQATKASAGIISPWLSQRRNKDWYHLAKSGAAFYPTLIKDMGLPLTNNHIYQQVGTLLFKKKTELLDKLEKLAIQRKEEAPEIGDIKRLSPDEIKKMIPIMTPKQDALFVSGGARIEGLTLIEGLIKRSEKQGLNFITEKVDSVTLLNQQFQLAFNNQTQIFDQVIIANGPWIGELLSPLGFEVDIRAQKGQLIEYQTDENTETWPVVMPQGEKDIIPFENGKIVVGATHENEKEFDLTFTEEAKQEMIHDFSQLMPKTAKEDISGFRVGTRAFTSDHLPFFGEVRDLPGLFVASGLGSSGLTTGPLIGYDLANFVVTGDSQFSKSFLSPNNYIKRT